MAILTQLQELGDYQLHIVRVPIEMTGPALDGRHTRVGAGVLKVTCRLWKGLRADEAT